jgi:hypothetical protein
LVGFLRKVLVLLALVALELQEQLPLLTEAKQDIQDFLQMVEVLEVGESL